jgi:acyl-CoA thioester hydrolase
MPAQEEETVTDFVARHRIRVRYCETDRMGIAHHGSYVDWFEEARTEWMRARGHSYREMEDRGYLLQIVDLRVQYKSPLDYDDEIWIETKAGVRRRATIEIVYEARRADDDRLVATGSTTLACVDRSGRLRRLPDDL